MQLWYSAEKKKCFGLRAQPRMHRILHVTEKKMAFTTKDSFAALVQYRLLYPEWTTDQIFCIRYLR